jgi:urease accessory protein
LNSERNPERVGRDGFLRLRFARSGGSTILAQSRFSLPLQALTPLPLENGASYLMLLNPTGGVLGGDHLVTEIEQEAGTHICLTTPSATRIYRTVEKPATLETMIRLGEGATLEYFPDHVIPHAGSALRQSLHIEMSRGSRAIILDSMASGRVAHGERWSFTEVDSRTEVFACDRPVYINRTRIVPATNLPDRLGWMEEFDYMSCMGMFADGFARWKEVSAAMNEELKSVPNVRGGASLLSRGGCLVRFLARSASDMTLANKKLWDVARWQLAGLPPFDHRKY